MPQPPALSEDQRREAVALYVAGHTCREIAETFGLSADDHGRMVWRAISANHPRRNGPQVAMRRPGPRGRVDVSSQQITELRDTFRLSWPEIAKAFAMSESGVRARYMVAKTGRRWR